MSEASCHWQDNPRLGAGTIACYSLPDFAYRIASYPLIAVIPTFYAAHTSVSLAMIGTILFTSRLFDAITDPLVGHWSDRTVSPLGRRKPWMIAGTVLGIVSILHLYRPPADADALYMMGWMSAMYLAWTMLDVPYRAWGAELTPGYHERSRVTAVRSMFATAGGLVFLSLPLLPMFGSTAMSPAILDATAWIVSAMLPICVGIAVWLVPTGTPRTVDGRFLHFMADLMHNRPAQLFSIATVLGFTGVGANSTMILMFMEHHLDLADRFSHVLIAQTLASIATLPLWYRLSRRFDKKNCWAAGYLGMLVIYGACWLVPAGPQGFTAYLCVMALSGVFEAILWFMPSSVLADIIDYDRLRFHRDRAGKFFALYLLLMKAGLAIGAGTSFALLSIFDFQVGGANDDDAKAGLMLAYLGMPALCIAIGAAVSLAFPLDERRHTIILRRNNRRSEHGGQANRRC